MDKKLSVVIPTLQKNTELLSELLNVLSADSVVDEIILIDNSLKGFSIFNEKIRVITPKENIYVNPSWNLGVKEAKNDIVALLNDDIMISEDFCSQVVSLLTPEMGCVGADSNYLKESEDIIFDIKSDEIYFESADIIPYHWGISIFFYKSSYYEIPDEMKIYRGDDWLFYKNKNAGKKNYTICGQTVYHWGKLSTSDKSLNPIQKRDRKIYRQYTKKWYNFIFDIEEVFSGYRVTFLGIKNTIKLKKKQLKKEVICQK